MFYPKENSNTQTAWCPGCGNFAILEAVKKALVDLSLKPKDVLFVSGIGQAGKLPHYIPVNLFNSLHGRALPVAIGAKLGNHTLTVIAEGGDGDGYAEGGNHVLHAMRRNHNLTYIVHDNQVYGLTKGQASPTSDEGFITKSTPHGASSPINPIVLAISAGATFVARGFAGEVNHLADLIKRGITHKGFSLIDILQPCVSFNKQNTWQWYLQRIRKLDSEYDPTDKVAAIRKAEEWGSIIPVGVIYQNNSELSFEEGIAQIKDEPLVFKAISKETLSGLLSALR